MAQKTYDSIRDDYKTPASIYVPILDFLDKKCFWIDVCCTEKNIPAVNHIHPEQNGLMVSWHEKCFMNPPFSKCRQFIKKAVAEVETNNCEVWAVLPADRFETVYYRDYILHNKYCVFGFLTGKQGFIVPGKEDTPPVPSQKIMIACFSKRAAEIQYGWNSEKLFNTKAFLGGVE